MLQSAVFSLSLLPLPLVLTWGGCLWPGQHLEGASRKASPHLSWRRVKTGFACPPCSVSVGSYYHGNQPKSLPDSKRFPFLSFGVTCGLSSLGLASSEAAGYFCILLPSWCLVSRTAFMTSALLPMVASLGLLEGPHRLLSQLMVFVITVIGCPCSHSLSLCPKGRNSGASCRPHTCLGFA